MSKRRQRIARWQQAYRRGELESVAGMGGTPGTSRRRRKPKKRQAQK